MMFFALLATAHADEPRRTISVVDSDGIEDASLSAALSPGLLGGCVDGSVSYLSLQVEAAASAGGLALAWQTTLPEGSPLAAAQDCLEGALSAALSAVMPAGSRALLQLQVGDVADLGSLVGATGTQHSASAAPAALSAEDAAAGLTVSVATAEGIEGASLEAGIAGQRGLLGGCYAGPAGGGRVSLMVDWTRKEQHLKLTSYTSHMQETGVCIESALLALTVRELEGAGKSGKATFEVRFKPPE